MSRLNSKLMAGAVLALIALGTDDANANGFALRVQSAVGLGMAFAGEGTPGMGLSAMFWNPSAAFQADTWSKEAHVTYVSYESRITALTGTTPSLLNLGSADNIGKPGTVPTAYAAYRINPRWFTGLSIDAPYGLGTHADNWAGQQLARSAGALAIEAAPVLGWNNGDKTVSIAAGPRILWFRAILSQALLGSPGQPSLPVGLSTNDVGFGFVLGATYKPDDSTEIALGYRSKVDLDLRGKSEFPSSPVMAQIGLGAFDGARPSVAGDLTLPDQAILSVRRRVTDHLTLLGSAEWTGWSVLQTLPFTFTDGPAPGAPAANINFNYRDSHYFSAGAEYEWSSDITLRAGIGFDDSPIGDDVRSTALPESDSTWLSAGASYRLGDRITLDLAYMYVSYSDAPISVVAGHPDFATLQGASFIANADSHAHFVGIGFRYHM
jgi:long-chain fatty acid transport protein